MGDDHLVAAPLPAIKVDLFVYFCSEMSGSCPHYHSQEIDAKLATKTKTVSRLNDFPMQSCVGAKMENSTMIAG